MLFEMTFYAFPTKLLINVPNSDVMEKISDSLKAGKEKFYRIQSKWTEDVKPITSDFTCSVLFCRIIVFT